MNFKTFRPRVDQKRRLVLTRFYTGIKGTNSFCYQINRITKSGQVDKKFKTLYSFGTDDINSIKEFYNSSTGKSQRVFKSPFKSVVGASREINPEKIWTRSLESF